MDDIWYYIDATADEPAHCLPCAGVTNRAFSSKGNNIGAILVMAAVLSVMTALLCVWRMPPRLHRKRRKLQKRVSVIMLKMAREYTLPNKGEGT